MQEVSAKSSEGMDSAVKANACPKSIVSQSVNKKVTYSPENDPCYGCYPGECVGYNPCDGCTVGRF